MIEVMLVRGRGATRQVNRIAYPNPPISGRYFEALCINSVLSPLCICVFFLVAEGEVFKRLWKRAPELIVRSS